MSPSSPLAIFSFAFAVSIGAVVSPGPVSAAIVTEAPRNGWRVGPLIATGHVLLELLFIILISLGLTTVLAKDGVQKAIALGGSLLLFFMGGSYLNMVIQGKVQLPKPEQRGQVNQHSSMIFIGVLTTISNPFWYAWWATVVPGYLAETPDLNFMTITAFYLGHISVDYLWDTLLSTVISSGGRWLSDNSYRILILITGGFMIYLGVLFLRTALDF